jgi:CRISPR-associated protein Cmr6
MTATLGARLIVNQAVGVLENAGLALDRSFGFPVIPGSAIKGLARAGAAESLLRERQFVFGWAPNGGDDHLPDGAPKAFAGTVAFLAAAPADAAPLKVDIVNCHHPDYYAGKRAAATDDESPNPQFFLTVQTGAMFRFALLPVARNRMDGVRQVLGVPPEFDPVAAAKKWLLHALNTLGAGAKTAAGYGWFEPPKGPSAEKGQKAANAPADDYPNEASFENAVLKRLDKPQEYGNLKAEIAKLREARNAGRVEQIKRTLADPGMKSARKRLKDTDWFPKEWLPR